MPLQILLVEDNADLRREIGEYLTRRLHEVTAVGTSADARAFLASPTAERLDVVLCDVNLQDGDGIDLFVELGALRPACSWLLMSGNADPQRLATARQRSPQLPSCTLVAKPVSLRELANLISSRVCP